MRTAARLYLGVGVLGIALYVRLGGSDVLFEAYGQLGWIAVVAGILLNRPRRNRLGWSLLAVATFLSAAGDFTYFTVYGGDPTFPSACDPFYWSGTVVLALALLALIGDSARRERGAMVDAVVLSLAVALVFWAVFFEHGLAHHSFLVRATSIVYPVVEMLLLGILVRVLLERGRRTTSYAALGGAVLLFVVVWSWYVVPAVEGRYVAGTWHDAGWLGSYVLFGFAALHPSMRVFVRRTSDVVAARRAILLGASLVVGAVAEVLQQVFTGHIDPYAYGVFGVVASVYVTARIVGLVRDLDRTRRQVEASERLFRMVFERAPVGISLGRNGMMERTNPALHRMLGYSGEELARMHYTEVTHPDDRALAEQLELDAGTRSGFSIDKRYRRKDGEVIDTHVHVALDLEDGIGVSLLEDVTERRELEGQLRQAQKMEAVGKLAGGIAHDFNNLMTAVIGYSDLILRRLDGADPTKEKVEAIRDSALRANDLTKQLLAFGRKQMLDARDVDLRDVVARMESLLRRLIGEDVVLRTEMPEPVWVRADPTQLEQVVMNLAVNARDAMPNGGSVTIGVRAEGDEAVLCVTDTGVGMDEAVIARIFEPFFTTKPFGQSSGLGLSTVHGIVGQSGGTIAVESEPGRGARFAVRLPLVAAPRLPEAERAATLVD